ncbi:fungal transcriptional regulatory protein [Niveomyces insectorum RCEF 264]|uniref:Fungal transcriptional regulatory protein n=1 Tax=Niveomyces insectorum RCEF 264 TaxID=1081102 RepID=A0A167SQ23_9HYPO|nr:fungal transcriptional regulatory protein [Niveomyces insectorum RCEF 264]
MAPRHRRPNGTVTRIRKACDLCRLRKVKCDGIAPCASCTSLGVDCTFQYVSRHRGPTSRYAKNYRRPSSCNGGGGGDVPSNGMDLHGGEDEAALARRSAPSSSATETANTDGTPLSTPTITPLSTTPPPPPPPPPASTDPAAWTAAPSSPPQLHSSAIAPRPVLARLVDDFFTYLHPLMPFPHEPTFRNAFAREEAHREPRFVALLAGMVGCLAASFPRSVRAHLRAAARAAARTTTGTTTTAKADHPEPPRRTFTRAICFVEYCRDVALTARGATFYAAAHLSVDDAATSYFLGLAAGYTFQWHLCRRFLAEALAFVQELGTGPMSLEGGLTAAGAAMAVHHHLDHHHGPQEGLHINHVDDQIRRRLFWTLFLAARSLVQIGAAPSESPLPLFDQGRSGGHARTWPDLPAEVDDAYITPDAVHPQPAGTVSLLTGFNTVVRIYATMDPVVARNVCGVCRQAGTAAAAAATTTLSGSRTGLAGASFAAQRMLLVEALHAVKAVTETLPDELYLPLPEATTISRGQFSAPTSAAAAAAAAPLPPDDLRAWLGGSSSPLAVDGGVGGYDTGGSGGLLLDDALAGLRPRRQAQYDVQKTNIYASQLATRSYYVETYLHLRAAATAADELGWSAATASLADDMDGERARIVKALLFVLAAIPPGHMEPNGSALVNKIRQVASTLVPITASPPPPPPVSHFYSGDPRWPGHGHVFRSPAQEMEAQLGRFLAILVKLDRSGAGPTVLVDGGGDDGDDGDDEEELQNFASLRDEQMRFAANGGFLGLYGRV